MNSKTNETSANKSQHSSRLEERLARYKQTERWLRENREKYMGQWVALEGDRLLASGLDGNQVYAEAVATGIAVPLLQQINEDEDLPFAGW